MGWDYCCCAIPVLNVGAYFTLSEQFVLGILVGTLSFATPTLVGASLPFSFSYLILLGLGYLFAAVQLVGFLGIFKEKPTLFRRYVTINSIVLYVGFSAAATFLGISASRHSQAVTACEKAFFAGESTSTTEDTKGEQICNIFCWATLGVMGALLILLFIVQSYLVLVLRNYGVSQRADHTKYHSIYSAHDGVDNIMLNNVRSGTNGDDEAWNTRPSTDSWHNGPRPGHGYSDNEPVQYQIPPAEKGTGYGVGAGTGVLHAGPSKQASVDQAYLEHPSKAEEVAAPLVHAKSGSKSDNFYDPAGAPPSYHGHDSEAHYHDKGSTSVPAWQQQQPFNPYQSSKI